MTERFGADFARTRAFWRLVLSAAVVGALTGLGGLAFLGIVHVGEDLLLGNEEGSGWFSGSVAVLPVLVGGGIVVGLLRRRFKLPDHHKSIFQELAEGRVEPRDVPGTLTVSFASLAAAAPLGPEAAIGTLGGGLGTWSAERRGATEEERSIATFAGVGGAFGALISPLFSVVIALELEHKHSLRYFAMIVPGLVAAMTGFAVFYAVAGETFLGAFSVPAYELRAWHLGAAVGLGIAGAALALAVGVAFRAAERAAGHPAAAGGLIIGAIGAALPLTLFSSVDELRTILDEGTVEDAAWWRSGAVISGQRL